MISGWIREKWPLQKMSLPLSGSENHKSLRRISTGGIYDFPVLYYFWWLIQGSSLKNWKSALRQILVLPWAGRVLQDESFSNGWDINVCIICKRVSQYTRIWNVHAKIGNLQKQNLTWLLKFKNYAHHHNIHIHPLYREGSNFLINTNS